MKNNNENEEKVLYEDVTPIRGNTAPLKADPESVRYLEDLAGLMNRQRTTTGKKYTLRDALRLVIEDHERFHGRRVVPGHKLVLLSKSTPISGEKLGEMPQSYGKLLLSEDVQRCLGALVELLREPESAERIKHLLRAFLTYSGKDFDNVAPLKVVFVRQDE